MNRIIVPVAGLLMLLGTAAFAQPDAARSPHAVDLYQLIDRAADEQGKEIVDSRLPAGLNISSTSGDESDYESLLAVLRTLDFFALETADQILILPEQLARSAPTRILQEDDRRVSDHEIVTRIIELPASAPPGLAAVGDAPSPGGAALTVPILRPMMGHSAQLGAVQGTNKLIIVDRYDNVRRITQVIEEIFDDR
jgi:general secretion pathway protein D